MLLRFHRFAIDLEHTRLNDQIPSRWRKAPILLFGEFSGFRVLVVVEPVPFNLLIFLLSRSVQINILIILFIPVIGRL